ncbi:MAG: hypothetical protein AB1425_12600 [Actinomycetota bacterium]
MREELVEALKRRAGLTEEQARRAVEVFEEFLRRRREERGGEGFHGLFGGSEDFFEERR